MIGNAHVDPVWLWSWPAGVDEALATFRAAADRCDEYPEFIFTRGEAWLYRWSRASTRPSRRASTSSSTPGSGT
jgi:glycosyl hydrolase family 38